MADCEVGETALENLLGAFSPREYPACIVRLKDGAEWHGSLFGYNEKWVTVRFERNDLPAQIQKVMTTDFILMECRWEDAAPLQDTRLGGTNTVWAVNKPDG